MHLAGAAEAVEQVIAWGAPDGIRNGTDTEAFEDLVRWIGLADVVGCRLVRIVLGGPVLRGQLESSRLVDSAADMLAAAADVAQSVGVRLAVENHGDVTTAQLLSAIHRADRPDVLGVCFDTANALRVGEDATAAARAVAELTLMVHLKDVAPFDPRPSVTGPCSVAYGTGVVPIEDVSGSTGVRRLRRAGGGGAGTTWTGGGRVRAGRRMPGLVTGVYALRSYPMISSISRSWVISDAGRSATFSPWRSTTTRSASSITCGRMWLITTTDVPRSLTR